MRLKPVVLLILLTGLGCTRKTQYPGKGTNPLLPSIHQHHAEKKQSQNTMPHPAQSGVIAVVNTTKKGFLAYFDKRGNLHHRTFSGIFVTGKQPPELWSIHREIVKKESNILFKKPLTFDVLKEKGHILMSGASIIRNIRDQIAHEPKDRHTDFAGMVYHKSFRPFACALDTVTYLVKESRYWPGAAHPDAISALVALNTKTHHKMVFAKQFSLSTLLKQAGSRKKLDKCLSAFDSVVPVKGRGGRLTWVASFNHKFAYCNGMIDYRQVEQPPGFQQAGPAPCNLKKGVLSDKHGNIIASMVWDYRASDDCSVVIYLKKAGSTDRYSLTPQPKGRSRRRNLYLVLHKGNKKVLLGRTSRILCADFPDHRPVDEYRKK